VETNSRRVDTHICKDNIGVRDAGWKLEVRGQTEGGVEKNVVEIPMPLPELAIQIVIPVIHVWSVKVHKIASKQAGHENNTAKG